MDLIKKMEQLGANKNQLTSTTLALAIKAIGEDESVIPDTVRLDIENLASAVNMASRRLEESNQKLKSSIESADYERKKIEAEARKAAENYEAAKRREASVVTNKNLAEAIKAYRAVLQATTDVLGEMDKDAQIAAINAGSYIAWRGIMGGKFKDDESEKGWERI